VIEAFGQPDDAGSFIIGVIVFAILVIVNFVVITKGSTRIAEVAAPFSPGRHARQADGDRRRPVLGLIDETRAKLRRKEVEQESTFFGAMDGASKFVRGDAVAGLIITAHQHHRRHPDRGDAARLSAGQAANNYTV
jgi:flagellar biosynthesis protein FlhA